MWSRSVRRSGRTSVAYCGCRSSGAIGGLSTTGGICRPSRTGSSATSTRPSRSIRPRRAWSTPRISITFGFLRTRACACRWVFVNARRWMRTPQRPGARRNARSHQGRPRTAPPWSDGRITMEITTTDADGFDRLSQHADLVIVLISRADIEVMRVAGTVERLKLFNDDAELVYRFAGRVVVQVEGYD